MSGLGRALVIAGAVIVVLGLVLMLSGRFNLPLGRLPGDVTWRGKNTVVYFPIATSIIISIVLSLLLYLISRFRG
jgi:heme/copper-type cytochrome/quinol oxidase subunit 2